MDVAYHAGKFAEMVLYVAEQLRDDRAGGATKLNKVLFFAEFTHLRCHHLWVPETLSWLVRRLFGIVDEARRAPATHRQPCQQREEPVRMRHMRSQDGARNPWPAPTTGLWAPTGNYYPYSRDGYGYYNADGFGGCLVDGSAPPQHLLAAISAALFNCESAQATDTRERIGDQMIEAVQQQRASRVSNLAPGDIQALSACHGIVCETGMFGMGSCEAPPGRSDDG